MLHAKKEKKTATAIIVAAGSGSRMSKTQNKQFIMLHDMPVLAHAIKKFQLSDRIDSIIVVTKAESIPLVNDLIRDFDFAKVTDVVAGGETRKDSVNCGLALVPNGKVVAIHDGARPFVSTELIDKLISAAYEFGAAAPGVVPKDTVKTVSKDCSVLETPDRQTLRLIQTPQVFFSDDLKLAYIRAEEMGFAGTDDCSVLENMGLSIHIVSGEYTNIKVTTPDDIPIAEAICDFLEQ
ncbi:MAG: 2-C-methyl-D-erythritol 4-phosphate cytidylyltransferase [Clostridia bacterium]|nr:2-C-methyl-D-erythritol 4-phosphate cytidylyltransferase [Clostridia bacterium]